VAEGRDPAAASPSRRRRRGAAAATAAVDSAVAGARAVSFAAARFGGSARASESPVCVDPRVPAADAAASAAEATRAKAPLAWRELAPARRHASRLFVPRPLTRSVLCADGSPSSSSGNPLVRNPPAEDRSRFRPCAHCHCLHACVWQARNGPPLGLCRRCRAALVGQRVGAGGGSQRARLRESAQAERVRGRRPVGRAPRRRDAPEKSDRGTKEDRNRIARARRLVGLPIFRSNNDGQCLPSSRDDAGRRLPFGLRECRKPQRMLRGRACFRFFRCECVSRITRVEETIADALLHFSRVFEPAAGSNQQLQFRVCRGARSHVASARLRAPDKPGVGALAQPSPRALTSKFARPRREASRRVSAWPLQLCPDG
jgi:hypothetical protein